MKNLIALTSLMLLTVSTSSIAKNIYADVQVTDIEPKNQVIWERANKNTPEYPLELARSGIQGCTVLSFNISDAGKTENVEIIKSIPSKHLGRYSRNMLKEWNWVPALTRSDISPEKRTLRLDFCMGSESTEQTQKACLQQTQLACN
ncbi:energy transducer TonB [Shewanella gaetbuli]